MLISAKLLDTLYAREIADQARLEKIQFEEYKRSEIKKLMP